MKKVLYVLLVLALFSCKKEKKDAVVSVGKDSYTIEDLCEQLNIPPQQALMLTPEQKQQVIDYFVQMELFYKEAIVRKLDKDPDFQKKLEATKKGYLIQQLYQNLMREMPQVTEIEAKAYFQAHKDEYNTEIKIARIILDNEQKATEVYQKLIAGEDFAKLAKQFSVDTITGKKGGDYGWISRGDLLAMPEVEDAAFGIKNIGGISNIVPSPYGLEIIKLLDKRKMKTERNFDSLKFSIINKLSMERQRAFVDSLTTSWKQKYNVKVIGEK